MAKPSVLPIWDTAQSNSVEPDAAHKLDGWMIVGGVPEKPPLQSFNFWQNNTYLWIKSFNEQGIVEWDAATPYLVDYITKGSNGKLYIAISASTNKNPTIEPEWQELMGVELFNATHNYAVGDLVVYSGREYRANGAIAASAFDRSEWIATEKSKNYIINGSFSIAQENTSFALAAGVDKYTLDMHVVNSTGGNAIVTQVDNSITLGKTKKALRITGAAGVSNVIKQTRIEGVDAAALKKNCVYSVLIKNNSGNTINPFLRVSTANALDNFAAVTSVDSGGATAIANGAEARVEFPIDLSATANVVNGLEFEVALQTGAFVAGTIDIAEEQFEVGGSSGEYDDEPVAVTRMKCQRYWKSSYNQGVAPGTVTLIGAKRDALTGIVAAARTVTHNESFSLMASAPTITLYSPQTGTGGQIYDTVAAADQAKVATDIGDSNFSMQYVTPVQAGYGIRYHYTLDARL